MNKKNVETTKESDAFKGWAIYYNVDILNCFNPELRLKDTKSAIKKKLTDLLNELKGFKFMTAIVWD